MEDKELKFDVILKKDDAEEGYTGSFTGYAAIFNNVDRAGERILPGAFVNLDEFVKTGSITVGHDWSGVGVATIDSAVQDNVGLMVTATWLSTEEAQECRKACVDRFSRGKPVSMSIGYKVIEDRFSGDVRELIKIELLEASIVLVPANPKAMLISAKNQRSSSSKLADHIQYVKDDLRELVIRIDELSTLRHRDGKRIGEQTIEDLKSLLILVEKLDSILLKDSKYVDYKNDVANLREKYLEEKK